MSQGEPQAESVRRDHPYTRADGERRVPYYPPELKHHYIDLLRRVKADLSRSIGKPIGWQTIRDMIMEPEDAIMASSEEANKTQRGATQIARLRKERDAFLTIEHFKAWDRGAALPSDPRCYFIERFFNRLRKDGKIDRVEHAATVAKQRYVKDALFSLCRPDVKISRRDPRDLPREGMTYEVLRNTGFLIDGSIIGGSNEKIALIMLIGEVEKWVFDVEMLLIRDLQKTSVNAPDNALGVEDLRSDNLILLFHGFLVLYQFDTNDLSDLSGNFMSGGALMVRNSYDATADDLRLDGRLSSFMACGANIYIESGRVDLNFVAGQGLASLATLFPTTPRSILEPTFVQPRVTTRLSDDMVSVLAVRDYARPCFG